jgi:hypothetical protein
MALPQGRKRLLKAQREVLSAKSVADQWTHRSQAVSSQQLFIQSQTIYQEGLKMQFGIDSIAERFSDPATGSALGSGDRTFTSGRPWCFAPTPSLHYS